MVNNDQNVISLKHRVVRAVCRAAWEGEIGYEEREKIVMEVAPGPKPNYRCCVYKERAIVRERTFI